jgi:hypothetical protein
MENQASEMSAHVHSGDIPVDAADESADLYLYIYTPTYLNP